MGLAGVPFGGLLVLARRDRRNVARLTAELGGSELPDPILVPHLDGDVHDIAGLRRIRRFLFASDERRDQLIEGVVA